MAFAITHIEGDLIISDTDLKELATQQVSLGKVRGSMVVYQESWSPDEVAAFVTAAVGPKDST